MKKVKKNNEYISSGKKNLLKWPKLIGRIGPIAESADYDLAFVVRFATNVAQQHKGMVLMLAP